MVAFRQKNDMSFILQHSFKLKEKLSTIFVFLLITVVYMCSQVPTSAKETSFLNQSYNSLTLKFKIICHLFGNRKIDFIRSQKKFLKVAELLFVKQGFC